MQTPLSTKHDQIRDQWRLVLRLVGILVLTSPVCVAVEVDEENPQAAHETHHGAQSSPVLGLSDLRRVSRGRQDESSASEACEEPAEDEGEGGGGEAEQDPAGDERK